MSVSQVKIDFSLIENKSDQEVHRAHFKCPNCGQQNQSAILGVQLLILIRFPHEVSTNCFKCKTHFNVNREFDREEMNFRYYFSDKNIFNGLRNLKVYDSPVFQMP